MFVGLYRQNRDNPLSLLFFMLLIISIMFYSITTALIENTTANPFAKVNTMTSQTILANDSLSQINTAIDSSILVKDSIGSIINDTTRKNLETTVTQSLPNEILVTSSIIETVPTVETAPIDIGIGTTEITSADITSDVSATPTSVPMEPVIPNISTNAAPISSSTVSTNIMVPSGLTSQEFDQLIEARLTNNGYTFSEMRGLGNALAKVEKEYGINGMNILGIITIESGHGTQMSNAHNLGGITGSNGSYRPYASAEECILSMGSLLKSSYVDSGLTTMNAIGSKYCPGNPAWGGIISGVTNEYASLYQQLNN